mgnify:FL=1
MEVISSYVCGLDVHKKSITACILTPNEKEIRTFGTMTDDLWELVDWIQSFHCTHVAMESTGVYWKPIYNLLELEPNLKVLVVNAKHIKQVPGRKTDVKDAEWIAELLKHGLLNPSYIPNREQRELRELVRYRRSMIEEKAREANRIQKVLEGANIKLSAVATNVLGVSGRLMMKEIIKGEEDPVTLARLAKHQLKQKHDELVRSLKGLIGRHQKMMIETQLRHIEFLEEEIRLLDEEIKSRMTPFEEEIQRIDTIPGIGRRTAEQIIAEIGADMSRYASADHLASWAGMVPGQNESAGKRKSSHTRKGNRYLRSALVESAASCVRVKDGYLTAKYKRLAFRRGTKRARMAIAHRLLVIVYHLLTRKEDYKELGFQHFEKEKAEQKKKQAVKELEKLGFQVTIEPKLA